MSVQDILVASLMVLRQKVHSYHWEVTGISFMELHKLFQSQYEDILVYADRIAEHMRTLAEHPPSTLEHMLQLSIITETDASMLGPFEMTTILSDDFFNLANAVESSIDNSRGWSNIGEELHEYLMKQHWFMRSYSE